MPGFQINLHLATTACGVCRTPEECPVWFTTTPSLCPALTPKIHPVLGIVDTSDITALHIQQQFTRICYCYQVYLLRLESAGLSALRDIVQSGFQRTASLYISCPAKT